MDAGIDGLAQNLEMSSESDPEEIKDDLALYLDLKTKFLADAAHSRDWREQARKDYDFVVGHQWEEKAKTALDSENRVPITFNLTLSIIKAVAGIEINGRHEIYYYPRDTQEGDVIANELLNGCSKWMGQNCDAEDEQSEAFQDTLKCGMGWSESRMDYEVEADGLYIEEETDPLEMYWDKFARKKNLVDARRLWRARKMSLSDARALITGLGVDLKKEGIEDVDLNASFAIGVDSETTVVNRDEHRNRSKNAKTALDDRTEVTLVQCQWFDRKSYNRVADPFTGQLLELDDEEMKTLRARAAEIGAPVESVRQFKRVYRTAFIGSKVLWQGPGPCKDRFSWQCITGEHDKNRNTWMGLITVIRDPQMMANKWLSQATHIINTTAKGGILAEKSAFPDIREAQRTYARADAITVVKDGAISKGQIMAKPGPGMTAGYMALMQYAVESIWRVTGMNQEIMGMRDVNQPGILEQQRKQAALTILATMFDSLRRYRKNIGRVRLHFIQTYLSDGRIIRINGDSGMKAVRLLKDKTLGLYDVIVDDAPTSPNQKEVTFQMLMQLMPLFKDQLTPEGAAVFIEYSPLPSEAVAKFKKMLLAPPSPEQQMGQKLQIEGTLAKVENEKASAADKQASAALKQAQAGKTQAEGILQLAQLGVAASQQELNRIKGAVTVAKAQHSMRPDDDMSDDNLVVQHDEGVPQLPTPPPVPASAPRPDMQSLIDMVPPDSVPNVQ